MKLEAVVFDMDGLMFDTENLWLKSIELTNTNHGFNVSRELAISCMGKRLDDINKSFKEALGQDFDTKAFRDWTLYYMKKEAQEHGVGVKEGLENLLNFLKEHKIKMAVASSAQFEEIRERFEEAKVSLNYFDKIIAGDMVNKPKPDPEIYLKACKELNANPKNSIALEDSEYGIMSARAANMIAINIPDIKPACSEASVVLNNLNEVITYIKENFSF